VVDGPELEQERQEGGGDLEKSLAVLQESLGAQLLEAVMQHPCHLDSPAVIAQWLCRHVLLFALRVSSGQLTANGQVSRRAKK
jgi:hypothetical protein